ncbi:hypothetical protein GUJ93_ZPchr0001g31331 [Zizania palustris]|uniref:Uncharacterized protein n=1 Tax=Zizania palustris TaxID=103762 RepID=A0A8J5R5C1_ZIZPA|nr:hypothetical protein GUJ93_ZPchr0001g31331 [Zizania palustris]
MRRAAAGKAPGAQAVGRWPAGRDRVGAVRWALEAGVVPLLWRTGQGRRVRPRGACTATGLTGRGREAANRRWVWPRGRVAACTAAEAWKRTAKQGTFASRGF